ncbi:MAG: hypothetical protein GX247_04405 [Mollicutes bacterium]|nr:hypothetical protein [Mollicutes bacterium]
MELMQATVKQFKSKLVDNGIVHYIVDDKKIIYPYGIVDEDKKHFIDINNYKIYHVLKKAENGRINESEESNIKLFENYVLHLEKINFNDLSYKERLLIKLMLKIFKDFKLNPKKEKMIYKIKYKKS